ncbi:MAG: winged helix-turn-helix domain-containing protein [Solirubrobacterales bacterium]
MSSAQAKPRGVDELIVFVLKHPIRVDALAIFNEREASVVEIARLIGEDEKKVGNHVRALLDCGCIERVRSAKRRGAEVHFYRASLRPHIGDKEWATLSPVARHEISALVFQAIVTEILAAFRTGRFDARLNRHLSWRAMQLDELGWTELTDELRESLERIEGIATRSEERLAEAGKPGFPAVAAAVGFERALPGRTRTTLGHRLLSNPPE